LAIVQIVVLCFKNVSEKEPVDQRRKRRTFREVMQTYGKFRAGNGVLTALWKTKG
jgi:hypothetical protein